MKTPDVTPNQYATWFAGIVAAAVVLFKLNVSGVDQAVIVVGLVSALGVGQSIADAIIRHGRSSAVAAQHALAAAQIQAVAANPDANDSARPGVAGGSPTPPATA